MEQGELDSYLIEITADILKRKDDEGQDGPIVDYILDAAGNKGTGKWTSQSALDLGVPLSLITESVFARYISAYKEELYTLARFFQNQLHLKFEGDKAELIEKFVKPLLLLKNHLLRTRFCAIACCFSKKITGTSTICGYRIYLRDGCIIRSRFLQKDHRCLQPRCRSC